MKIDRIGRGRMGSETSPWCNEGDVVVRDPNSFSQGLLAPRHRQFGGRPVRRKR